MEFAAMQKLTILDFPGTVACILFTKGCNFRCPFCHNAALVTPMDAEPTVDETEVLQFLKSRQGLLEGVVITGGEPMLHKELPAFLAKVKDLGYKVKVDTNGSRPDMLKQAVCDGLIDYAAMDIKNAPDQYAKTIGLSEIDMQDIEKSKNFLMEDHVTYEFRTTVVKGIHTGDDLERLAQWIEGAKAYFLQGFKDSGQLLAPEGLGTFTEQEMNEFAEQIKPYVPSVRVRGYN